MTKIITDSANRISRHTRWKQVFWSLPGCLDIAQLYSLMYIPQDFEWAVFALLDMTYFCGWLANELEHLERVQQKAAAKPQVWPVKGWFVCLFSFHLEMHALHGTSSPGIQRATLSDVLSPPRPLPRPPSPPLKLISLCWKVEFQTKHPKKIT